MAGTAFAEPKRLPKVVRELVPDQPLRGPKEHDDDEYESGWTWGAPPAD